MDFEKSPTLSSRKIRSIGSGPYKDPMQQHQLHNNGTSSSVSSPISSGNSGQSTYKKKTTMSSFEIDHSSGHHSNAELAYSSSHDSNGNGGGSAIIKSMNGNIVLTSAPLGNQPPNSRKRNKYNFIGSCCRVMCHHLQSQWKILFAGQILSFLMACTGAAQATLSFDCQLSAPTFCLTLFYLCLSFCLIPIIYEGYQNKNENTKSIDPINQASSFDKEFKMNETLEAKARNDNENQDDDDDDLDNNGNDSNYDPNPQPKKIQLTHKFLFGLIPLSTPAYLYLGMAFLDVYANYFTVRAFRYTTITSVTLLDALAIPSSMILSKFALRRNYSRLHLMGAALCMIGVILNVFQDYEDELKYKIKHHTNNSEFPHKFKGDIMGVAGGILFGVSSVVTEISVRDLGGPNEYLGMLGFFATIICAIQTLILERDDIKEFTGREEIPMNCTPSTARVLIVTFVLINTLNYIGRAYFLQISEAAFLNLSLLTGDMWSVLFSVFAEHIIPNGFFYVALVVTLSGVVVYEIAPSPIHHQQQQNHHPDVFSDHHDDLSPVKTTDSDDDHSDHPNDVIEIDDPEDGLAHEE